MDKNQKVKLYEQLDDLIIELRDVQCTVELLSGVLAIEGGVPTDRIICANFNSSLNVANSALYKVWDKLSDLTGPLKQALTEE